MPNSAPMVQTNVNNQSSFAFGSNISMPTGGFVF